MPGYNHKAELKEQEEKRKWTVRQRVDDYMKRSSFSIEATCKRNWYAKINSVPPQVINQITKMFEKEVAEEKRVDALTPQERDAETAALLGELFGQPGFVAVRLPTK